MRTSSVFVLFFLSYANIIVVRFVLFVLYEHHRCSFFFPCDQKFDFILMNVNHPFNNKHTLTTLVL